MTSIPTLSALPPTLQEWRRSGWEPKGTYPRSVWDSLEQFFLDQGLILWKRSDEQIIKVLATVPPNDNPRCPDAFAYTTKYNEHCSTEFYVGKAVHCPARTTDNHDVLIRLITKGEAGGNHLTALRRLGTGPIAVRGDNHIVPVLREIVLDDMIFAIFPLMNGGFDSPWYYNFGELIDAVDQVLEGVSFCHERLVAHLDLDRDNILVNYREGPTQQGSPGPNPFRAYFPIRYYLNDFELAVCFDEGSNPSTRVVTGLPTQGLRGKYGRDVVPEMLSDMPYCPFRADVWQLGRMFTRSFGELSGLMAPFHELFTRMTADDPLSRPTASEALDGVRQLKGSLSGHILTSPVPRPHVF